MKKFCTRMILFLCCFFFSESAFTQNFINEINIPYLISSDTIRLEVSEQMHSFSPDDTGHPLHAPVTTFAYNQVGATEPVTVLGPTIYWNKGASLHTEVTNNLDQATTTHWHGGHVPQFADGGPHQLINGGDTWTIDFDVLDRPATMWYHPHAMGTTYEQVQMGLAGMLYVDDPQDGIGDNSISNFLHDISPHHYNKNDFPLIFQTKYFELDPATNSYAIKEDMGYKKDYEYLVNGIIDPYMRVPANMIRLRILNGDSKFTFNFGLVDAAIFFHMKTMA